jgi:hypothetical protein
VPAPACPGFRGCPGGPLPLAPKIEGTGMARNVDRAVGNLWRSIRVIITVMVKCVLAAAATGVLLTACTSGSVGAPAVPSPHISGLLVKCLTPAKPEMITCRDAAKEASLQGGPAGAPSSIDARLTSYSPGPTATPVEAWVLTYHRVPVMPVSEPVRTGPTLACFEGDWRVVISASTGLFLVEGNVPGKSYGPCASPS